MKKYLYPLLFVAFAACNSSETPMESSSADCFCKAWGGPADPSGKDVSRGFEELDKFLRERKYIRTGSAEEYKKFALDSSLVSIPPDHPYVREIALALGSGWPGAPDVSGIGKCIDSLYRNTRDLDTADAMYKLGKSLHAIAEAGAPDKTAFYSKFFTYVTAKEMRTPVYRNYYYLLLSQRFRIQG